MTRTTILATVTAAALGLAACGPAQQPSATQPATPTPAQGGAAPATPAPAASKNITFYTFETLGDPEMVADYTAKFGEAPEVSIFADEDEAFTKMRAGFAPDVMAPCSYEFERWKEAGLLQPIDVTKLASWDKIAPALKNIPGMMASETTAWFIPQYFAATSVTFRTDLAPEYASNPSWDILFDPKYKGKVSALEGVDDTVALVAKHMGFNPYALTPDQWTAVQAKLGELVAQSRFVTTDQTQIAQSLQSGEIVAAITWSDSYGRLRKEGVPVGFMKPASGWFTYVCGFVVHKDATALDRVHALIDAGLSEGAARYLVENLANGSANAEAMAKLPQDIIDQAGLDRDVNAFLAGGTFQVRMPNKDAVVEAWTNIRAGVQ